MFLGAGQGLLGAEEGSGWGVGRGGVPDDVKLQQCDWYSLSADGAGNNTKTRLLSCGRSWRRRVRQRPHHRLTTGGAHIEAYDSEDLPKMVLHLLHWPGTAAVWLSSHGRLHQIKWAGKNSPSFDLHISAILQFPTFGSPNMLNMYQCYIWLIYSSLLLSLVVTNYQIRFSATDYLWETIS